MQPANHMKPSEDELITHIKDSLSGYEEAYVEGAWENFDTRGKKDSGFIFWMTRVGAAAAVLFLIGTAAVLLTSKAPDQQSVQIPRASLKQEKTLPDLAIHEKEELKESQIGAVSNDRSKGYSDKINALSSVTVPKPAAVVIHSDNVVAVKTDPEVTALNTPADDNDAAIEKGKMTFQEFLENENKVNNAEKTAEVNATKKSKWGMGLVVAPSFGNTRKLNMGYGVSMGYAVSDKISLNSGISYNEMAASRNMDAPVTMGITSSKDLESTEAKLVGIDIPLEIKYYLSKNLYANAGISAFAVLDQKRNNTYIEGRLVERAVSVSPGVDELKTFAVKQRVTEEAPVEPEIKDGKYLGFYNFSFGYKQKVSKNKTVSVEPFMKVPMKDITKENLRLMGTGVRLKFDF